MGLRTWDAVAAAIFCGRWIKGGGGVDFRGCQRPMNPLGASPRKILIVKLSAIGDVIQTLPMFTALRRKFPMAEIDWLVEEDSAGLLKGYPGLDNVIVSRRKSWQRGIFGKGNLGFTLREIRSFLRELRKKNTIGSLIFMEF
jgi:hypothetical protein